MAERMHDLKFDKAVEGNAKLGVSARWLTAILEKLLNLTTLRLSSVSLTGLDRLYSPSRRFRLEHLQFVDTGEYSERQTVQNVLEILWLFDRIGKITVIRAFAHEQGVQDFDVLLQRYQYMHPSHLSVGALHVLDRPRGIEF